MLLFDPLKAYTYTKTVLIDFALVKIDSFGF
jgi:hypothetical protein